MHETLAQILNRRYAVIGLNSTEAKARHELYEQAVDFFALPLEVKERQATESRNVGFRPIGHAYVDDHPDQNESFLHWMGLRDRLENSAEIEPFLASFDLWHEIAADIVGDLIEELRDHYSEGAALLDSETPVPYRKASFLQINSFPPAPAGTELLQEAHEDAVFATVIWTSADGLELMLDDGPKPVTPAYDQVYVMPGGIMTAMTGGEIKPLYHRARNLGLDDRKSIMYFSSPDVEDVIEPFVVTDENRDVDIRELVIGNPAEKFRLRDDFITGKA